MDRRILVSAYSVQPWKVESDGHLQCEDTFKG